MRWRKLGPTLLPAQRPAWMRSHAAVPFAEHLKDTTFRVYFSGRDAQKRSHTGWALVDLKDPGRALELSAEPVLAPGALGCFDDSGAMLTWIARDGERRLAYYIGWNLGVTVPFRNAIGLAVSKGGAPFVRYAEGPILDRTPREPQFVASCCVVPDGALWRMWYLACVRWEATPQGPRHHYHIRYAESNDGVGWRRQGRVAIDFRDASEHAISRPSVVKDGDRWRMWFSARGDRYRIWSAESSDAVTWRREDRPALDASPSGWDADMVEYPHVFDHGGRRYMLYNGNGYGESGFGFAVLD